jgi:Ti-type conjugative transfer relaxase TraA
MAIYHLHVKVIGRASGSSAVASAAYRAASRLRDDRIERSHDFTAKRGVVHSEVLLPETTPEAWSDREQLWNAVEAVEVRKDAQLAREVEFAIPREMTQAQGIALARDFVQAEFVDQGMIADLNVHWDRGEDGLSKPHAHVMLTMRSVDKTGFGPKMRDWNRTGMLERWRERWAALANARLAELDIDTRIDHRSFDAQGIELEPQNQIGAPAQRIEGEGLEAADRAELHREIARGNGERIIANPALALEAITYQQSTFTGRDMARFAHRHSDSVEQFNAVVDAMRRTPDLMALGQDGRGEVRFTTRAMIATEQRLHRATEVLVEKNHHEVLETHRDAALARGAERGLVLSREQADALTQITTGCDLGIIVGHAGTGKSAMLGVAREAWEAAGFRVSGAALSGIAADGLQSGSGIASRTIASLEHGWAQDRDRLSARDVLVIDEAGMVGTRQLERVLSHAADAWAKIVLVGDPQQLQSIEAGAAFRSLYDRHGGAEIGEVRRQRTDWQRDATRDLATGRTGAAIQAYEAHGMVHGDATRDDARTELIDRWDRDRQAAPDQSRIILTHTNAEVRLLNDLARQRKGAAGDLGEDVSLTVERGDRRFANGDRVMFLQNDRGLRVKNGTLGTVDAVSAQSMSVLTDDGRSVRFDLKDYNRLDHGYAATIHKAQGMTVDRAHVLATPGLDVHGSYVALSRHRDGMDLHYGRDDFASQDRLIRTLSRDRSKDMAQDYAKADPAQDFAARRGITFRGRVVEVLRKVVPERLRDGINGPVDGVRPGRDAAPGASAVQGPEGEEATRDVRPGAETPQRAVADDQEAALRKARTEALKRHARAVDAVFKAQKRGDTGTPDQLRNLSESRAAFEKVRPHGWRDAEAAYAKNPTLAREAGSGQVNRTIRALQLETELRTAPERRAAQFVDRWKQLDQTRLSQYRAGKLTDYEATRKEMGEMAKSLQRDPQLESVLANRKAELGIRMDSGRRLGAELAYCHAIDITRGRGLGL